jgi:hypothetical protein
MGRRKSDILKNSGIYLLLSKTNRKIFYIGASENLYQRNNSHYRINCTHPGIAGHVKRYGKNDLKFCVIKECDSCHLQYWEQYARIYAVETMRIDDISVSIFNDEHNILEYLDNYLDPYN